MKHQQNENGKVSKYARPHAASQPLLDHPLNHAYAVQFLVAHRHSLHGRGGTAGRWRKRTFLSGYYSFDLTEPYLSDIAKTQLIWSRSLHRG